MRSRRRCGTVGRSDWVHLNLPAIAQDDETVLIDDNVYRVRRKGQLLHAEREGPKELAELEKALGRRAFAAQYLQQPIAPDGTIIHWSWFQYFDFETLPERQPSDEIVQSWDTAAKVGLTNDYSVGTTWLIRDKKYYLLDLYRGRLEFPDLRRKIIDYANAWSVDKVVIEDASSGEALYRISVEAARQARHGILSHFAMKRTRSFAPRRTRSLSSKGRSIFHAMRPGSIRCVRKSVCFRAEATTIRSTAFRNSWLECEPASSMQRLSHIVDGDSRLNCRRHITLYWHASVGVGGRYRARIGLG